MLRIMVKKCKPEGDCQQGQDKKECKCQQKSMLEIPSWPGE